MYVSSLRGFLGELGHKKVVLSTLSFLLRLYIRELRLEVVCYVTWSDITIYLSFEQHTVNVWVKMASGNLYIKARGLYCTPFPYFKAKP